LDQDDMHSGSLKRTIAIIEEHLPNLTSRAISPDSTLSDCQSILFAHGLEHANRNPFEVLGYSPDVLLLEEVQYDLRILLNKIANLSPDTKSELGLNHPSNFGPECENCNKVFYSPVVIARHSLSKLLGALESVRAKPRFNRRASKKRNMTNWRAASVASVGLCVWARGTWAKPITNTFYERSMREDPDLHISNLTLMIDPYDLHLRKIRGRSEKPESPGPLGRFLEALFVNFGILTNEDAPVAAATALNSLKKIEKDLSK